MLKQDYFHSPCFYGARKGTRSRTANPFLPSPSPTATAQDQINQDHEPPGQDVTDVFDLAQLPTTHRHQTALPQTCYGETTEILAERSSVYGAPRASVGPDLLGGYLVFRSFGCRSPIRPFGRQTKSPNLVPCR